MDHKFADFRDKLKSGHYDSITGARRAVSKFKDWAEEDRERARKLVDSHFGAEAPVKKAVAKKTDGPPKRRGRPPGSGKKQQAVAAAEPKPAKRRGRPPGSGKKQQAAVAAQRPAAAPEPVSANDALRDMTKVIGTMSEAVRSIKEARELIQDPKEVDTVLRTAVSVIGRAMDVMNRSVVGPLAVEDEAPEDKQGQEQVEHTAEAAPEATSENSIGYTPDMITDAPLPA